jgi:hypothetical protein
LKNDIFPNEFDDEILSNRWNPIFNAKEVRPRLEQGEPSFEY